MTTKTNLQVTEVEDYYKNVPPCADMIEVLDEVGQPLYAFGPVRC